MRGREWFPGGPPGDDPSGGAGGSRGIFNPISRVPQWLRVALGLTADEVPKTLRVDQVLANIDIAQLGWGYVEYIPVQTVLSIANGLVQIPPALDLDNTVIRRLVAIDVSTDSVTAFLRLRLETPALGLVLDTLFTVLTETSLIAAPALATTADITQGVAVVIPQVSRLALDAQGVVGAETVTIDALWARFPAGFPLPL